MDNEMQNTRNITMTDLFGIFVTKFWIIFLVVIIAVGGSYAAVKFTYVPKYRSTATLYILKDNEEANSASDFTLALNLVNDCTYLLKSHSVLDSVIDDLKLDMKYSELAANISTKNPDSTRVLEISVIADSPQKAKRIVDTVCVYGCQKISKTMGFDQTKVVDYGKVPKYPYNRVSLYIYAVIGLVVAVVLYLIFLLAFIFDDSMRTNEEIEKFLNTSIIGEIPNIYDVGLKKYSKYGKYKYAKYRKYSKYSKYYRKSKDYSKHEKGEQ